MRLSALLLVVAALAACTSDTAPRDGAGAADTKLTRDSAPGHDLVGGDGQARDRSVDGTVVPCTKAGAACADGLTCQCCGSIGPKAICLCSKTCSRNGDCFGTGLPSCNRPDPSSAGICTPLGYNCCWMCQ